MQFEFFVRQDDISRIDIGPHTVEGLSEFRVGPAAGSLLICNSPGLPRSYTKTSRLQYDYSLYDERLLSTTGYRYSCTGYTTVSCDGGVPQYTARFYSLLLTRHMLYVPT